MALQGFESRKLMTRQEYLGTLSVGASTEAIAINDQIFKRITLSRSGLVVAVSAAINNTSQVSGNFSCGAYTDDGTEPDVLLGNGGLDRGLANQFFANYGSGKFYSLPLNLWLDAGSYWFMFAGPNNDIGTMSWYLETTGGSDREYSSQAWFSGDMTSLTTSTTKDYSLKISVVYG